MISSHNFKCSPKINTVMEGRESCFALCFLLIVEIISVN